MSGAKRAPVVLILVGSQSDEPKMTPALEMLDAAKVPYEFIVSSAHRDPDRTAELARTAKSGSR